MLETPETNLVSGMKWLMGTFSQGWNRARLRRGHVFQGRYKAIPVSGAESDAYYFRIVADYIHLNPARAGLAGGERGALVRYKWSSLPCYVRGNAPDWLVMERVLRAFELSQDGRGRRAYIAWLEARACNDGGKVDEAAMDALRRGWYLGKESFKDKVLKLLEKPGSMVSGGSSRAGAGIRDHGEKTAERIVLDGMRALGIDSGQLSSLPKSDGRKVVLAMLLREATSVSNAWIAERLCMGHPGSVSRNISLARKDRKLPREMDELRAKVIA